MKKFILSFATLLSLHAFAQENISTLELEEFEELEEEQSSQSAVISLNTLPILLSGFGAGADLSVSEKLSLGLFGSFYKIKTTEAELDAVTSDVSNYGVRARYFLNSSFSQQGWYSSLSLVNTTLKTTVEPFFSSVAGVKESNTISRAGGQIGIGYQLIGRSSGDGQFCFTPELTYGMGNKIGYQYTATTSSTEVESRLEDGVGLEANIGWLF